MGIRKVLILPATALLFSCVAMAINKSDQAKADALLVDALARINDGKFDEASLLLDNAEKANPDNDAVQYYKGYVAAAKGNAALALLSFENASRMDSTNVWYKRRLAGIYSATGKYPQASKVLKSILSSFPYDLESIANLLDVSMSEGKVDQADSLITVIEKLQGRSDYTTFAKLELYLSSKQGEKFFGTLNEFVATSAASAQEKSRVLRKLLSSPAQSFNQKHIKDWGKVMETAVGTHPSDTSVLHLAASFFYSADEHEKVSQLCQTNKDDEFMVTLDIYSSFRYAKYRSVIEACDRLVALKGNRNTPGEKVFLHTMKGDSYQQMNKPSAAFSEYEAALKIEPDNVMVLNNYAYYMSCLGKNLKKCEQMSRITIQKDDGNPTYLDTYAWILYKMKRYDEAKSYMKKALGRGGKEHAEILEHYACILEALGENTIARSYRQLAKQKASENAEGR